MNRAVTWDKETIIKATKLLKAVSDMDFTQEELKTISEALHELLDMHISADYEVEEIAERIDDHLEGLQKRKKEKSR